MSTAPSPAPSSAGLTARPQPTSAPMSRSSSASSITLVGSPVPKCGQQADLPPLRCATCAGPLALPAERSAARIAPGSRFDPAPLAAQLRARLAARLGELARAPRLVGLLGRGKLADAGSDMYARTTARACARAGIGYARVEAETWEETVAAVVAANDDDDVDGLVVYFPLFGPAKDGALRRLICARVDVEGVNPLHTAITYALPPPLLSSPARTTPAALGAASHTYPCTPLAVVRVLEALGTYDATAPAGERLRGTTVAILNRSDTVGGPLAAMLANDGALVFSLSADSVDVYLRHARGAAHEVLPGMPGPRGAAPAPPAADAAPFTPFCTVSSAPPATPAQRAELLLRADVVVAAVPGAFTVPTTSLRPGAAVVDLSERGNFDADVCARARAFAPRIGSVTVCMLLLNAVEMRARREAELRRRATGAGTGA